MRSRDGRVSRAARGRLRLGAGAALLLVSAVCGDAVAQEGAPEATAEAPATVQERIAAARAEIGEQLERARSALARLEGQEVPEPASREISLLERHELVLSQWTAALTQGEELRRTEQELLEQTRAIETADLRPSVIVLDVIRDELRAQTAKQETVEAAVRAGQAALVEAKNSLAEKETARRQGQESLDTTDDPARKAELGTAVHLAELESRLASDLTELRRVELENQKLQLRIHQLRLDLLRGRERRIAPVATLSHEDLRTKLVELEAREDEIKARAEIQQRTASYFESNWFEARGRLDAGQVEDAALAAEVEARKVGYQTRQRQGALLNKRLERLANRREVWNRRYRILQGELDAASVRAIEDDAKGALQRLGTEYQLQELELRNLRNDLVTLDARLEGNTTGSGVAHWIRQNREYLGELATAYEENIASIESSRRLYEKLLEDIGAERESAGLGERLDQFWLAIVAVWRYEITAIEDRSITVGKVVVGLVLLFLGFYVSRLASNFLGRRVLPRLGLHEGATAAIRSIVFYVLIVTISLVALRVIHVPLTAFTLLGGALAIGIGFGSQNIVNNFMSGLIMLVEQPIRVGDLVQIGNLYGSIVRIGARSTRVRTGEDIVIVVPNSSFLEKDVVNWTLSGTRARVHVAVGVSYGSPPREVVRLLRKAVDEHGRVLRSPEPIVLFTDFGDNALCFEVHFWIRMHSIMDRRILESDIRHRIESLLGEAGIVIAFPQRDVHLDALRPIDVRVVADARTSEDTDLVPLEPRRTGSAPAGRAETGRAASKSRPFGSRG